MPRCKTITPHDLRHTCATLVVSSGAHVLAMSRMLGHEDQSVTLRISADLFDNDLDAVAVDLDAKIAESGQTCPQSRSTVGPRAASLLSSCTDGQC